MPSDSRPTVLITGAGSGLGEAMASSFARKGYDVAVCDIDLARAENVLENIIETAPGSFSYCMDVRSEADWDDVHQRVLSEWGRLNILVNNAGVAAAGNCEDTSLEDWRWVIDINQMGVILGCHRFITLLRKTAATNSGHCHLVNVASFAGMAAMPGMSAYGVAKAAVVALSEQLRAELYDSGIGVSVVCPAFVKTRLLETFRANDASHRARVENWMKRSDVTAEDVASQTLAAISSGRFLVLTHSLTKRAWFIKRLMPERYFRRMIKMNRTRKPENEQTVSS